VLLHASAESETRTLTIVGAVIVLVIATAAGLIALDPFGGRPADRISVSIEVPYVVQGIIPGTALVMHGVQVGSVTGISSLAGGGVRLNADLQSAPTAGLTDAMRVDYRTINYFGVSGLNLSPGVGGEALRNGLHINTVPAGNYTLQAMLTRLGQISNNVITPELVGTIERITTYTDEMNPMIETVMIAAQTIAGVQRVPTERLLANASGISVALPAMVNALTDSGDAVSHSDANWMHYGLGDLSEEQFQTYFIPTWEAINNGVFAAVGKLESSHVSDLLPLINGLKPIMDTVPPLLRPEAVGDMLVELRTRFQKLYGGTPDQRALQVRVVLDNLPGIAAPIDAIGGAS